MRNRLYLVKFGGSLITDKTKPYTPRIDIIRRLVDEVKEGISMGFRIIVGHGGGSFPHVSASKYRTHLGFVDKDSRYGMAKVHYDAAKLNGIVVSEFLEAGLNAFSIQPSAIFIVRDGEVEDIFIGIIEHLLDYRMIPVVYGDVVIDLEKGCHIMSTEEVFKGLSLHLLEDYDINIIMCEIVDGIYTKDPFKFSDAEFIPIIDQGNIDEVRGYLSVSHGIDVTGGMRHKVDILFELAKHGINSIIINGLIEDNLRRVLLGEDVRGTRIKY
jgi:isopentenyl phosphate kinase